jgi:hypothetical protein
MAPGRAGQPDRIVLAGGSPADRDGQDFRPLAAEWLAQGRVHAGLILLLSTRTRTRNALAVVAGAIENVLRDHPNGLSGSERWIGPLPDGYGRGVRPTGRVRPFAAWEQPHLFAEEMRASFRTLR